MCSWYLYVQNQNQTRKYLERLSGQNSARDICNKPPHSYPNGLSFAVGSATGQLHLACSAYMPGIPYVYYDTHSCSTLSRTLCVVNIDAVLVWHKIRDCVHPILSA